MTVTDSLLKGLGSWRTKTGLEPGGVLCAPDVRKSFMAEYGDATGFTDWVACSVAGIPLVADKYVPPGMAMIFSTDEWGKLKYEGLLEGI